MAAPIEFLVRLWRSRRARIILSAVLVGITFGITKLGLPVEDVLIGARTVVRREEAPKDIVVVALDERTLREIGLDDAPRSDDAKVIEAIFDAGAKRVFFDRSYHFREEASGDVALAKTLSRYPGKVFFGGNAASSDGDDFVSMLPAEIFRKSVGVTSLSGFNHPFMLSVSFPFRSEAEAGAIPSMSSKLANLENPPDGIFRPDYAMDASTIPTASYIDVLRGKSDPAIFAGNDVIVSPTALNFHDLHRMPFQGYLPGAYFQVIAAQTLKRGVPLNLGWLPVFVLVIFIVATGVGRGHALDRYRVSGLAAVILFVPLVLDSYGIQVEVVPAAIAAGIALFRARTLDRVELATETNLVSGLPSLQSLRNSSTTVAGNLVALKIRNYGAITGSFTTSVEAELADEIVRRIRISDPGVTVYHESDMFLWASGLANPVDLFEHLEGLHRIVQNGVRVENREIDLSFNCGIDTDMDRPIDSRIASAMQSAEQAVRDDEIVSQHKGGNQQATWDISLLSSLDRAIDNGEVWVAYQPKLDLAQNRIVSAEALVRWTHPERGPISPEEFIGIAEEYHRIDRITQFVLNEAVRSAAGILRRGHDFCVSVNISAQLLRFAGLRQMIEDALTAHKLSPDRLILEITETDRLDRSAKTLEVMKQLVESGLHLSIDDFGTGNATIDYLRYLPASEVKIDKVFVSGMETNRSDMLLVQSIIEMAHSLDRRVVAEGVETQELLEMLRGMGCDEIQGYHVSRPVRIEELLPLIEAQTLKAFG